MLLYDGLYSWAKYLQKEKHTQQPFESLLLSVFNTFLKNKRGSKKKPPAWVKELKEIIQDHIDTNLSLKELSKGLEINPSYLSREFSRYFEDLSFGDYIRKQRIEKAIELMKDNFLFTYRNIIPDWLFRPKSFHPHLQKTYRGKPICLRRKTVKKSNPCTKGYLYSISAIPLLRTCNKILTTMKWITRERPKDRQNCLPMAY